MSKRIVLYLIICLLFGVVCFISTNNIIVSGIVVGVSALYFIIFAERKISKSLDNVECFHECYRFINSFLISINVKGSLPFAFETVKPAMSDKYLSIIDGISEMNENEKLEYLSKYYHFHIYSLFLNVINLWQEQGGDILQLSSYLIEEARNVEEYVVNAQRISKRKLFEFSTLWLFSLAILVILRYALTQFFPFLSKQLYYPICIGIFFLFILFSTHVIISRAFSYEIKGWSEQ